uniref:Uncharacterized protein n=1 Tax=Chenopodium quinoa TaxID=63459 RepID=A0A803MRB5_CHEQI
MANLNRWIVYQMGVYLNEPLENYITNIDWNKAVVGRFFGPNPPSRTMVQQMVDTQWLSREALLEQHTFVLDGRIGDVRRCNRFTVPANVNFDMTRLYEGVLTFCKKWGCVGHYKEICICSDYVAARHVHSRMEAFESQDGTISIEACEMGEQTFIQTNRELLEQEITVEGSYCKLSNVLLDLTKFSMLVMSSKTSCTDHHSSSETNPTTPESYHNPQSTRFDEENRAAIPRDDPYAPFTAKHSRIKFGGGFRISADLEEIFLSDCSGTEELVLPPVVCSPTAAATPALFENLSLNDNSEGLLPSNMQANVHSQQQQMEFDTLSHKRRSHAPFHRCHSYNQDPFFGYQGWTWSQKRRKIKVLNFQSKGGFTMPSSSLCQPPLAKSNSDVSTAAHMSLNGCSSASLQRSSSGFVGSAGRKRKGKEPTGACYRKLLKLSEDRFVSKAFRNDRIGGIKKVITVYVGSVETPSECVVAARNLTESLKNKPNMHYSLSPPMKNNQSFDVGTSDMPDVSPPRINETLIDNWERIEEEANRCKTHKKKGKGGRGNPKPRVKLPDQRSLLTNEPLTLADTTTFSNAPLLEKTTLNLTSSDNTALIVHKIPKTTAARKGLLNTPYEKEAQVITEEEFNRRFEHGETLRPEMNADIRDEDLDIYFERGGVSDEEEQEFGEIIDNYDAYASDKKQKTIAAASISSSQPEPVSQPSQSKPRNNNKGKEKM